MIRTLFQRLARPQIVIHGRWHNWMQVLGPGAALWRRIPGYEVARGYRLGRLPTWRKRYVIPLFAANIRTLPRPCWALAPGLAALDIFSDKARFARYAAEQGLSAFLPAHFDPDDHPGLPLVLKRTNLFASDGVAVVEDAEDLRAHLAMPPWAGQPVILQELIEGSVDHVTHLVAIGGRIAWHCTYDYPLEGPRARRGNVDTAELRRSRASAEEIAVFERFLAPLGYDGPANIDFKRRPDGRLAIFEINPRLGGSLMRPENIGDLEAAITMILAHATWHPRAPRKAAQ